MKSFIPMLFTALGGVLGSLYGYLNMVALIPVLIASDIPVPVEFGSAYQERYFYILLPVALISGWWIGKWRASQIESLESWRKWVALILLGLIVAVLGFAASTTLFFISA